ncbi:MAG TPA: ribonuclease E activity regulator RraA [Saprospiraceae bacterium]|nr:ribonuclease E activity regulator RraA [Saprospiraceae bacterium]
MKMKTTDICDEYTNDIQIAEPIGFKDYGKKRAFYGKILTVKCFENNPLVREVLSQDGTGNVLVIDGGGSLKCALLGDMIAEMALSNNWRGLIVYACVRDSVALSQLNIGIKALNTNPLKSRKEFIGDKDITVQFAGIDFIPGEYVYCDEDGIIVSNKLFALDN